MGTYKINLLPIFITSMLFTSLFSNDICYFFSHGLADTHKQAFNYVKAPENAQKPYIIDGPLITFDYPDATTSFMRVNRTKTSLAQENEIKCLTNVFDQQVNAANAILIGVSRGASALVTFMALNNPDCVKAIILESPFDCVENVVAGLLHQKGLSWIPGSKVAGMALIKVIFAKYKESGIRPIDQIAKIKKDIPILIICSAKDNLVPTWSSINVYLALKEAGNANVHLLILPQGNHAKLITHDQYGTRYQNVTHAFYQKYNLPHSTEYAQQGILLFKDTQPSRADLISYFPQEIKKQNGSMSKK
jgi:pimeloyl-ACP methyl ester carboxylesterase